jgi:hypothetical protein
VGDVVALGDIQQRGFRPYPQTRLSCAIKGEHCKRIGNGVVLDNREVKHRIEWSKPMADRANHC